MSSTGAGVGAPGGGGGIPPGRPGIGTAPTDVFALAEVIAFADWFGYPNKNNCNGVSLSDLPLNRTNCDPASTMTTLVSLKPVMPSTFLGLFPSVSSCFLKLVLGSSELLLPLTMVSAPFLTK